LEVAKIAVEKNILRMLKSAVDAKGYGITFSEGN